MIDEWFVDIMGGLLHPLWLILKCVKNPISKKKVLSEETHVIIHIHLNLDTLNCVVLFSGSSQQYYVRLKISAAISCKWWREGWAELAKHRLVFSTGGVFILKQGSIGSELTLSFRFILIRQQCSCHWVWFGGHLKESAVSCRHSELCFFI